MSQQDSHRRGATTAARDPHGPSGQLAWRPRGGPDGPTETAVYTIRGPGTCLNHDY